MSPNFLSFIFRKKPPEKKADPTNPLPKTVDEIKAEEAAELSKKVLKISKDPKP